MGRPSRVQPGPRMRAEASAVHPSRRPMIGAGMRRGIRCLLVGVLVCVSTGVVAGGVAPQRVDFRREILPILSANCFLCHGPDARTRKAGLRLDLKETALRTKDPVI